jgi:hypothetical protein
MKLTYVDEVTKIIPGYGVFKKDDVVEYDEILEKTGLFEVKNDEKKEGNE